MKYSDVTNAMTNAGTNRYLSVCGGNTRKAMTLYRKNLPLTQEIFTIISCFEVALRNTFSNLMARHEPICFVSVQPIKNTTYARQRYNLIFQLFQWMQIDAAVQLYGLDHINTVCNEIDNL